MRASQPDSVEAVVDEPEPPLIHQQKVGRPARASLHVVESKRYAAGATQTFVRERVSPTQEQENEVDANRLVYLFIPRTKFHSLNVLLMRMVFFFKDEN